MEGLEKHLTNEPMTNHKYRVERPLHVIADEILSSWKTINQYARYWAGRLSTIGNVNEQQYKQNGEHMVNKFLLHSTHWRGEDARRIKAELKQILKEK